MKRVIVFAVKNDDATRIMSSLWRTVRYYTDHIIEAHTDRTAELDAELAMGYIHAYRLVARKWAGRKFASRESIEMARRVMDARRERFGE